MSRLSKFHKKNIPLRPIVNSIGSPYDILRDIAKKIKPDVGMNEHHIIQSEETALKR